MRRVNILMSALYTAGLLCLVLIILLITPGITNSAHSQETESVFFDSDTNEISQESTEVLDGIAESLIGTEEYIIMLEGYSDITGKADYNVTLSRKRAQLVKDYLIKQGLSSSKIEVAGRGGTEKFGAGETNEALQANRRVTVTVDIPYVAAIEIETEEVKEVSPTEVPEAAETPEPEDTPKPTEVPQATQEPEPTEAPAEESQPENSSQVIPRNIEKEVRKSASERVLLITPNEMKLGQTYTIEAQVKKDFLDALSGEVPDISLENMVGLRLDGERFDIKAQLENGKNIKDVTTQEQMSWEWYVTPVKDGYALLTLSILVNPNSTDNQDLNNKYETIQSVVDVKPNLIYSVTSSYWIMGVLILLIILVVARVLTSKFKFD